jgi:hypothetical protein
MANSPQALKARNRCSCLPHQHHPQTKEISQANPEGFHPISPQCRVFEDLGVRGKKSLAIPGRGCKNNLEFEEMRKYGN